MGNEIEDQNNRECGTRGEDKKCIQNFRQKT